MFRKYSRLAMLAAITALSTLLIISCGGGGGGDSAPVRDLQPISYTGNTAPVAITLANTPTLVSNVLFTGTTSSDIPSGVSISEAHQLAGGLSAFDDYLVAFYHFTLDQLIGHATDSYSIPVAEIINRTVNCESGYYTEQGTIDDLTGAGTVTCDYYDCLLDGVIADGRMLMHFNYITVTETITELEVHINMTNEYVLMTYTGSDLNVSVSGTLAVDGLLSVSAYSEQYREQRTRNYVKQNNINGKMYKYENFVITSIMVEDYLSNSRTIAITGTPSAIIYDSLYGSLKVETIEPLSYSSVNLTYPDGGGPMLYTGDNSTIQLGVESVRHAKLELVIDVIAGYEVVRYALWTELEDTAGLILADSDGDGMHDSWEESFGLDPNINDAAGNLDNDALTNLEEYEQGYDPNNPLSP